MKRTSIAVVAALVCAAAGFAATPSFDDFDRRAREGDRLSVVFFGASLTWGANATDPLLTSYRADVARRLEAAYPEAHFKFWDAAIGGTGSQLGVFRLERDVLRRRPDLVFLDFSANDDITTDTPETLASYEAIVRRLVSDARCPVVQVILPFKWNVAAGRTDGMKRRDAHLAISRAYATAAGDAIALAIERVRDGAVNIGQLWPHDGVHPGDAGYGLFADAAWSALQAAVKEKRVCRAPDRMLHADTYLHSARVPLASLGGLPAGWRAGAPNLTSAHFDFLMSRWLDGETIASRPAVTNDVSEGKPPERFRARFSGSMVMLFGEATKTSGKYRVWVDARQMKPPPPKTGEPPECFDPGAFAQRIGGNGHHVQVLAAGLDATAEHTIEIEPVLEPGEELRLESLCVAGGSARVLPAK